MNEFNPLARRQYFRQAGRERWKEQKREAERQELEQVQRHLAEAVKALKFRSPVNLVQLSYEEQLAILERYAERLTEEMVAFRARWGAAGRDGVLWIKVERDSVLVSLARTRLAQLREENEPKRREL